MKLLSLKIITAIALVFNASIPSFASPIAANSKVATKQKAPLDAEAYAAQVFYEALHLYGASALYLGETGSSLTDIKKLAPEYLRKIPAVWNLVGDEFQWNNSVSEGNRFCVAFNKEAQGKFGNTYQCVATQGHVALKLTRP